MFAACERAGFAPDGAQEAAEMHTALALVAAGMGVTLAPASARNAGRRGLVFRPLTDAPRSELAAVTRRGDDSPAAQSFLAVLRETA